MEFVRCNCNLIVSRGELAMHHTTREHEYQMFPHTLHQLDRLRYGKDLRKYARIGGELLYPCATCGAYINAENHPSNCLRDFYSRYNINSNHIVHITRDDRGHIRHIYVEHHPKRQLHRKSFCSRSKECDICYTSQNTADFESCEICCNDICYACYNSLRKTQCPFCRAPYAKT